MLNQLKDQLRNSLTAYHVVSNVEGQLRDKGFVCLEPFEKWSLKMGDKAYTIIDGSSLVAFRVGEHNSYNIVASHTDSPCFKLKNNAVLSDGNYKRLNVEEYGKCLQYTWFDRPLKIAGRIIVKCQKSGELRPILVKSEKHYTIPSLAVHLNRKANEELKLNIKKDLVPLVGLENSDDIIASLVKSYLEKNSSFLQENAQNSPKTAQNNLKLEQNVASLNAEQLSALGIEIIDYDLFLVSDEQSYVYGTNDEFFCAPRLDNQTSVFASIDALINASPKCTAVCYLADNEEVGSRTKQGAGATVLKDVISRINACLGYDEQQLKIALNNSFMVSCDNSHAQHPNYPELSDESNRNFLSKGVVIKHHANQSYTTDAFSSAIIKQIFDKAGVKYQDFYNRSDLLSGGTLGAISSSQLSIRSCDIGLPQLAMHSAAETIASSDYAQLVRGLEEFFACQIVSTKNGVFIN